MRREPLGEVPSPTAQARAAQHRLFQRISQQTPRRATHPLRRCIQLFRCRPHRIARIVQQSNRLHCTAPSHLAAIVADVTEPVEVADMRGRRRHLRENVAHEGREPRGTFGDVRGQIALMKIESAARRSSVLGGGPSARRCANLAFEAGQPLFLRPRWRRDPQQVGLRVALLQFQHQHVVGIIQHRKPPVRADLRNESVIDRAQDLRHLSIHPET